jgi:hypothetical protein
LLLTFIFYILFSSSPSSFILDFDFFSDFTYYGSMQYRLWRKSVRTYINPKQHPITIDGRNTVEKSKRFKIPHKTYRYEEFISQICCLGDAEAAINKLDTLNPSKNSPKFGANAVSIRESE